MNRRQRKSLLVHALIIPSVMVFILPIVWSLAMSFRPTPVITSGLSSITSPSFTLENYIDLFVNYGTLRYVFNSLVVAIIPTAATLVIGLVAAYALVRFNFRGLGFLYSMPLFAQIVPSIQILIPIYWVLLAIGLHNTYFGVILAHTSMVLPLAIWMLAGYLRGVPREMEEAAMVDGCSRVGAIFRVVLPVAMPGVVATGMVAFINTWGEFLFGFTLLSGEDMRLISVAIYFFMPGQLTPATWGSLFAAGAVFMIPSLLLFFGLQRFTAKGLALGSVR